MRAELHQDGQLVTLKRSLRYRDLILYGIVLIQPTAPMPVFGVIYQESRGHVLMAILFALCRHAVYRVQLWTNGPRLSKGRLGVHVCG